MSYPELPAALSAAKSSNPLASPSPAGFLLLRLLGTAQLQQPKCGATFPAASTSAQGSPVQVTSPPQGLPPPLPKLQRLRQFFTSPRNTGPYLLPCPKGYESVSRPDCWNEEAPLRLAEELIHLGKLTCRSQLTFQFLLPKSTVALRV